MSAKDITERDFDKQLPHKRAAILRDFSRVLEDLERGKTSSARSHD